MPVFMMICEGVPKLESESILRASLVFGHQSSVVLRPGNSFSPCRNFPLESMRMAMSASCQGMSGILDDGIRMDQSLNRFP